MALTDDNDGGRTLVHVVAILIVVVGTLNERLAGIVGDGGLGLVGLHVVGVGLSDIGHCDTCNLVFNLLLDDGERRIDDALEVVDTGDDNIVLASGGVVVACIVVAHDIVVVGNQQVAFVEVSVVDRSNGGVVGHLVVLDVVGASLEECIGQGEVEAREILLHDVEGGLDVVHVVVDTGDLDGSGTNVDVVLVGDTVVGVQHKLAAVGQQRCDVGQVVDNHLGLDLVAGVNLILDSHDAEVAFHGLRRDVEVLSDLSGVVAATGDGDGGRGLAGQDVVVVGHQIVGVQDEVNIAVIIMDGHGLLLNLIAGVDIVDDAVGRDIAAEVLGQNLEVDGLRARLRIIVVTGTGDDELCACNDSRHVGIVADVHVVLPLDGEVGAQGHDVVVGVADGEGGLDFRTCVGLVSNGRNDGCEHVVLHDAVAGLGSALVVTIGSGGNGQRVGVNIHRSGVGSIVGGNDSIVGRSGLDVDVSSLNEVVASALVILDGDGRTLLAAIVDEGIPAQRHHVVGQRLLVDDELGLSIGAGIVADTGEGDGHVVVVGRSIHIVGAPGNGVVLVLDEVLSVAVGKGSLHESGQRSVCHTVVGLVGRTGHCNDTVGSSDAGRVDGEGLCALAAVVTLTNDDNGGSTGIDVVLILQIVVGALHQVNVGTGVVYRGLRLVSQAVVNDRRHRHGDGHVVQVLHLLLYDRVGQGLCALEVVSTGQDNLLQTGLDVLVRRISTGIVGAVDKGL